MTDEQLQKLIDAYRSGNYNHVQDIGVEELIEALEDLQRLRGCLEDMHKWSEMVEKLTEELPKL